MCATPSRHWGNCACGAPGCAAQVELVSEGDSVNELFIVVSGQLTSYCTAHLFNAEVGRRGDASGGTS